MNDKLALPGLTASLSRALHAQSAQQQSIWQHRIRTFLFAGVTRGKLEPDAHRRRTQHEHHP
jgi:hypothetical protein